MTKQWNVIGGLFFLTFALVGCGTVETTREPVDLVTPASEFFKGKTIRFIVGYAHGGSYDRYTQAMAHHISKYIPGNPTTVVQNMTGDGSLIAANYMYNRAKPDGLTVGVWNSRFVLQEALGSRGTSFKSNKFGWIGAPGVGLPACFIMGYTGLKTLGDVIKSKVSLKMATRSEGTTSYEMPRILNRTVGTNFKMISGFARKTRTRVRFAIQRKTIDGICFRSMLDAEGDEKLIPIVIYGKSDDPKVKNLPEVTKFIKGKDNLATFIAWARQYDFQRPLSLPPGTPEDRIKVLRKAYKATLQDREFLADAKKSKLIINYVSGERIERYVDQTLAISPEMKESLQFLVVK